MRLFLAFMLFLLATPLAVRADSGAVGSAVIAIADGTARPIETAIWYPAEATAPGAALRGRDLPLVVMSHGSGASYRSHAETAVALAGAGFVVAALTHTGDNFRDNSGAADLGARTHQLATVIGYMAGPWNPGAVNPGRIGAFGYSAGGFTALAVAGGMPDLGRIPAHCAAHPGFFECRVIASAAAAASVPTVLAPSPLPLRALVVAAPALGFTFGSDSLAALRFPVQLWHAEEDAILPAAYYAEPVRAALPQPPEFHRVAGAGHFDFQDPCSPALARAVPAICTSLPGFDRMAFHARFNAEIIRFLTEALRP